MPRRTPPDDYVNTDRWIISYADFITLLFAFFVVMYAVSSVNEEKYRELSQVMSGVFIGLDAVSENREGSGEGRGTKGVGIFAGGKTEHDAPEVTVSRPDQKETELLESIKDEVETKFSQLVDDGNLRVSGNDLWLSIELRSNLLFEAGSSFPSTEADPILEGLAGILGKVGNPIHVEGFTDDQNISTDQYPSNWELSSARAATIVRLLALSGLDPKRLAAVGYGEFQPAYSNRTAEGRRLNRRVVIVVSRDEKIRRSITSFGSQQVSPDAVSTMLNTVRDEAPIIEQVETDGGILFRQSEPEQ